MLRRTPRTARSPESRSAGERPRVRYRDRARCRLRAPAARARRPRRRRGRPDHAPAPARGIGDGDDAPPPEPDRGDRGGAPVRSALSGLVSRRRRVFGGRARRAILRRYRALLANAGVVERQRLRPPGPALPGAASRGGCAALLGIRGRRPELSLEQLPQPVSWPAYRRDGRHRRLPVPRVRSTPRNRADPGLSGKLGMDGSGVWDAYAAANSSGSGRTAKSTR